jgi:hypothetical protein
MGHFHFSKNSATLRPTFPASFVSFGLLAGVIIFTTSCSKQGGSGQLAAFADGRKFLQSVRLNEHPDKVKIFRAFDSAGIPLPSAMSAALNGEAVVDDEVRAAKAAAAKKIPGDHTTFRNAGVPLEIPMVDQQSLAGKVDLPLQKLALNDTRSPQTNVLSDTNNGGGDQCTQVNASCYAFAVASASAFACAYASAWACVFAEVPPFRQLCTWAWSQACVSSMSVAFAAAYSNVSVNVCNSCPGGNSSGGTGTTTSSQPTPTATPIAPE